MAGMYIFSVTVQCCILILDISNESTLFLQGSKVYQSGCLQEHVYMLMYNHAFAQLAV